MAKEELSDIELLFNGVLEPLLKHDKTTLRKKASQLKKTDGEGWAVGEMLSRAVDYLEYFIGLYEDENEQPQQEQIPRSKRDRPKW